MCNFYFHSPSLEDNPVREDGWQGAKPHDWHAHVHCRSQPENLPFLARLRELAERYGGRLLLGEIGDDKGMERQIEYTAGDRLLHMAYSFDLCSPERLRAILQTWLEAGEGTPVWAIGNHDVPRVATRWTGGQPDPVQLRMFAAFHACLPIGAGHVSKAANQQIVDDRSLLNLYRRLLAWRRDCRCVRTGSLALLETDRNVLVWSLSDGEDRLHCVFNFSSEKKRLDKCLADFSGLGLLFGERAAQADEALYLDGYGWSIIATSAPGGPSG